MIEAFDEVMNDADAGRGLQGLATEAEADARLEDDKGTADAVYALLLRGGNWLESDALVEIKSAARA